MEWEGNSPGEMLVVGSQGYIRALGPFHHPRDIVVHRTIEPGSHLLDGVTETTRYHYSFPVEKKIPTPFNFSGSIGFIHEITAVQKDLIQHKKASEVYPPGASLIVMGVLDEIRKQIGLKYPFEDKSKL